MMINLEFSIYYSYYNAIIKQITFSIFNLFDILVLISYLNEHEVENDRTNQTFKIFIKPINKYLYGKKKKGKKKKEREINRWSQ